MLPPGNSFAKLSLQEEGLLCSSTKKHFPLSTDSHLEVSFCHRPWRGAAQLLLERISHVESKEPAASSCSTSKTVQLWPSPSPWLPCNHETWQGLPGTAISVQHACLPSMGRLALELPAGLAETFSALHCSMRLCLANPPPSSRFLVLRMSSLYLKPKV